MPLYILFSECLFMFFLNPFSKWIICCCFCYTIEFREFFIYFWYQSFARYMVSKYFISVYSMSFHPLSRIFPRENFILLRPNLSIFPLVLVHLVSSLRYLCLVLDPDISLKRIYTSHTCKVNHYSNFWQYRLL